MRSWRRGPMRPRTRNRGTAARRPIAPLRRVCCCDSRGGAFECAAVDSVLCSTNVIKNNGDVIFLAVHTFVYFSRAHSTRVLRSYHWPTIVLVVCLPYALLLVCAALVCRRCCYYACCCCVCAKLLGIGGGGGGSSANDRVADLVKGGLGGLGALGSVGGGGAARRWCGCCGGGKPHPHSV